MNPSPLSSGTARPELKISLRPATPEDQKFLQTLYASTRQEEMSLVNWSAAQKEAFLLMQFSARQRSYESSFPGAAHRIILVEGALAGAMIVSRNSEEIRLVDISLLPERRNQGIGSRLIGDLIAESVQGGLPLRLSVLQGNRAAHLYERLGFAKSGEDGMYAQMERKPA